MTDEKKPDDKKREKVSDEEMKDVSGGMVREIVPDGKAPKKKKLSKEEMKKAAGGKKRIHMETSVDIDATGTHYEN